VGQIRYSGQSQLKVRCSIASRPSRVISQDILCTVIDTAVGRIVLLDRRVRD